MQARVASKVGFQHRHEPVAYVRKITDELPGASDLFGTLLLTHRRRPGVARIEPHAGECRAGRAGAMTTPVTRP